MIDLYKKAKFELRPPMGRPEKTKEENVDFWVSIKKRLKAGDPVTGNPTKFSFGAGFNTVEKKIIYCNDMIYFIKYGMKRPDSKKKKIKIE